jgi:hypothetical protein
VRSDATRSGVRSDATRSSFARTFHSLVRPSLGPFASPLARFTRSLPLGFARTRLVRLAVAGGSDLSLAPLWSLVLSSLVRLRLRSDPARRLGPPSFARTLRESEGAGHAFLAHSFVWRWLVVADSDPSPLVSLASHAFDAHSSEGVGGWWTRTLARSSSLRLDQSHESEGARSFGPDESPRSLSLAWLSEGAGLKPSLAVLARP